MKICAEDDKLHGQQFFSSVSEYEFFPNNFFTIKTIVKYFCSILYHYEVTFEKNEKIIAPDITHPIYKFTRSFLREIIILQYRQESLNINNTIFHSPKFSMNVFYN